MVFTNKNSFSNTTMKANNYQKFRLGSTFVREIEGRAFFFLKRRVTMNVHFVINP